MNYEFFLSEYLVKDALYFQNKKNKLFLAANPNVVLPNSVLVFVSAKAKSTDNGVVAEHAQLKKSLLETLQTLKNRGRKVIVFYQTDLLTVYEIINEPGASKIHDLVFTKR
jgi:DNA-directed RNA polymerase specialized sigma subunit